jgi:2-polyprenyl-3-methyl-5-hydroxy-6-metoxy-1,4-benzoquinol methylase
MSSHHKNRYEFAANLASGRILDASCGCGYGSQILSRDGKEVVGVDLSPDAVEWAEEYFPGPKYIVGNIEDEPWEGKFQTVVSLETIEHIKDPTKALQAFRRACVGEFIASVPNEENYPFKAENFANDESPHYRHYRPQEFEALLTKHGFSVVERCCQASKSKPEMRMGTDGKFLIYVCT